MAFLVIVMQLLLGKKLKKLKILLLFVKEIQQIIVSKTDNWYNRITGYHLTSQTPKRGNYGVCLNYNSEISSAAV